MEIESALKLAGAIIGLIVALVALFWKFPDRRRQIHMNQHKVLQPILDRPLNEHHDLVLETAFRFSFNQIISASEVRFLFDNRFSLFEIERFCYVKEHLCWDKNTETYRFNNWNKKPWWRKTRIVAHVLAYTLSMLMALYMNLFIDIASAKTVTAKIFVVVLFFLLILTAIFFLWRGTKLVAATRFIKNIRDNAIPRRTICSL